MSNSSNIPLSYLHRSSCDKINGWGVYSGDGDTSTWIIGSDSFYFYWKIDDNTGAGSIGSEVFSAIGLSGIGLITGCLSRGMN